MAAIQFCDLPMIPQSIDEPSYASWGYEQNDFTSPYGSFNLSFSSEADSCFGDIDHGMASKPAMERFMHDQYPLTHGVLHAKIPLHRQLNRQYEDDWPTADCYRNVSPDRTSASGQSSQATQNELRTPPVCHAVTYGSPTDFFPQSSLPYPTIEHFSETTCLTNTSLLGGSVSLRQLEYEHHEPEPIVEEKDIVDIKEDTECDSAQTIVVAAAEPEVEDCREYADSGIGNSVRDAESVQPIDVPEDPASDSDYSPSSSRQGKRRRSLGSNGSSSKVSKRRGSRKDSQVSSPTTTTKVPKRSRGASNATKSYVEIDDERRPFPCPLAIYGCDSTFASKNEWKRHVSTQHIKLDFWRCDLCQPTTDPNDEKVLYYNDFNRKDLFTQHLRRMHATPPKGSSSHNQKEFPVSAANLSQHQSRCLQSLRTAPQQSVCLFCEKTFNGLASWDERMEHIGRHLEKDRSSGIDMLDTKSWNADTALDKYLLREGLIVKEYGKWRIGDGKPVKHVDGGSDDDAESEDE